MNNAKRNGNEQAFATPGFSLPDGSTVDGEYGLTKREEFAKAAMQGILSSGARIDAAVANDRSLVAIRSVEFADALLAALSQETE